MELSFTYCIFDQFELREKKMTTRINVEELPDKRNQQLSNVALNKHNFAVIWYLYAPIGKVLAIALSRLHTFDQISIYKGFGRYHPAREIEVHNMKLQVIRYYAASIYFQRNITTFEKMYTLYFIQTNMTGTILSASRTRVHNRDEMLYYRLFSIQSKHHAYETYPNISFHVREFHEWHNGDCTFGVFLFRHKYKQLKHHTLGPYCTDIAPNHPLIGRNGFDYLMFGNSGVEIIIYANGPLYTIDIDIVVLASLCEGVLEPTLLCYRTEQSIHRKYLIKFPSYSVSCYAEELTRTVTVTIFNISQCVLLQGDHTRSRYELIFEVRANIDFRMVVKLANNLLPLQLDFEYDFWLLTYKQEGSKVTTNTLSNATVLTKQQVSSVSFITSSSLRMHYTYSLHVEPRPSNFFSCANINQETQELSSNITDFQYMTKMTTACGKGFYRDSGNYLFLYVTFLSTSQIIYLRFTTLPCEQDSPTRDVVVSCPNAVSCYAADAVDKPFCLTSVLEGQMYRYEKNSACTAFTIQYNFAPHYVLATMSLDEQFTLFVRIAYIKVTL